ncbi:MAG: histidine kinase N-terminal 7TM domain-containing protein [Kiritimatiellia bacterium]|nr:histidine kinase N-terminal 7TM domain-containing protein [Kiritimatiellia bacterium]
MNILWLGFLGISTLAWFEVARWTWRKTAVPGSRPASGLFLAVSIYIGAYLTGLLIPAGRIPALWAASAVEYLGLSFIPILLLRTILDYTLCTRWIRPFYWVLLTGISAAFAALKILDSHLSLIYATLIPFTRQGLTLITFQPGPAYWVMAVYQQTAMLISLAALLRSWKPAAGPFRRQIECLIAACVIPAIGHVFYLSLDPQGGRFDPHPVFLAISLLLLLRAMFRYEFVTLAPLARDLLIDHFDEAVLVLDRARRLVDFNKGARSHLHLSDSDLGQPIRRVLRSWPEIVVPVHPPEQPVEIQLIRNAPQWWSLRWIQIHRSHREMGLMLVIRDDTRRRREEADRMDMECRILRLQKTESLGVLAGGISHEFNNLLMAVLGNLEMIRERLAADDESLEDVREAERAAGRAAELSRLMLDYSGQNRRQIVPIRLNDLVKDLTDERKKTLPAGIQLRILVDEACPVIAGDLQQIRRALLNLMENAIEAIENPVLGRIEISTGAWTQKEFQSQASNDSPLLLPGEYAFMAVRDNGCGIDAEWLPQIFDPFFSTRFTGRGLGLAAVQGIVNGHGGVIQVRSERGKGSFFQLFLPAETQVPGPSSPSEPGVTST